MKSEKGITLATLLVYIVAMTIIVGLVATILSFYNKNVVGINNVGEVNLELNKFESAMIKETQTTGNQIKHISKDRIEFTNGNTYTFENNCIFENAIIVSNNVTEFSPKIEQDGDKQILRIYVSLEKGEAEVAKSLSYVTEVSSDEKMSLPYAYSYRNNINFKNQAITRTYSTSEQTLNVTAPVNIIGTYSYVKKSGESDITVSSAGVITIPANKTVGIYTVVITVTDSDSGNKKDATYTITIEKQKVNEITDLTVSTSGIVTWTESSNATGYEISINGTNWVSATSGINYLNTITAATGSRTVYVRAINSDETNYQISNNVSKAVMVYSVELTKGTGISAVTGAGNYISGATVTLGATASTGYTWSKWIQTSGGAQVSTTIAYSATINGNWAYTANSTINSYNVKWQSGNLLSHTQLSLTSNVTLTYNNDVYTMTANAAYAGAGIPAETFEVGKTYVLSYKIKKTAGTLKNIGGHSYWATQQLFTIDGNDSAYTYHTPETNMIDDTNMHTIVFKFTYNGNSENNNNNIYIQPNRGFADSVTIELSELELYEIVKEETKEYNSTITTIPTASRTGYTFNGWYTEKANGTAVNTSTKIPANDVTYYTHWSINTYTITFNPNGGTMNSSTSTTSYVQNYNTTITMNNPTRAGYNFVGWVSNQRTNVTTAGYWTYTNSKDPLTGNNLAIINSTNHRLNGYAGGTEYTATPTTVRGKYSLSSYSTATATEVNYSSSDPNPLKNISATSFWRITRTSYNNVAYSNGPALNMPYYHKDANMVYVIVARFPQKWNIKFGTNSGFDSREWLTSTAGTGNWQTYIFAVTSTDQGVYMDGGYFYLYNSDSSSNATNPTMDIAYLQGYYTSRQSDTANVNQFKIGVTNETLTAKWQAVDQTVKITPNSTNGSYKVTATNLFDKTDMIIENSKITTRAASWSGATATTADSTHFISGWIRLVPGATYKITGATEAGLVEWSSSTNKTFLINGASQATAYSNNTNFTVPTTYVNTSGTTTSATYKYMRFHAKTSDMNNIKLEMVASPSYNSTQTLLFPNNATVVVAATANTGYSATVSKTSGLGTFSGTTTGTLTGVAGNATTTNLAVTFTANTYTVTLNNQSATTAGTTAIYEKYNTGYYTNSGATTQMTTTANGITVPTRTGYTFGGYYTQANGGGTQYIDANGKLTSSASTTNFTAAGTLYAKWTANVLTVNIYANGATQDSSGNTVNELLQTENLNYDGTVGYNWPKDYPDPWGFKLVRIGYSPTNKYHVGSASSSTTIGLDYVKETTPVTTIAERFGVLNQLKNGNVTVGLYAGWTVRNYTIGYTLNGGSVSGTNPTSYTIESNAITLNNPTKTGYTFKGWTDNQDKLECIEGLPNEIVFKGTQATITNPTSGNAYYNVKIQLLNSAKTYIAQINTTNVVGDFYREWTNTYDTGDYYLRIGGNGSKKDSCFIVKVRLEKGLTYIYGWSVESYTNQKIVINNIQFYKKGGSIVTIPNNIIPRGSYGERSYTANWTANELTFANQTVTKTFSTSAQTQAITAASNGTGTYTYSEVSEKNSSGTATSYISISGTTINIAASTPAGTYTYVIRAKDSNSLKTKDATYTITINKATNPIAVTASQSWSPTFGTSNQDHAFTAATSGQGAVTYAIQSQKNASGTAVSYFSIPTAGTASLRMAANTPVSGSKYTVVIRATAAGNANYNSGYKDITYTVTVSKANPTVTLSATSGSVNAGSEATFTAKPNLAGKWNVTTGNARYVTISSPAANAAATANTATTIKYKGVAATSTAVTIKVLFTPTDTNNYNAVEKTFSVTVKGYVAYSIGQEVKIGNEAFYVLKASSASESTVTLLAKYNLDVNPTSGKYYQKPNAAYSDTACAFSSTNYWSDDWVSGKSMDLNTYTTATVASKHGQTKENNAIMRARDYATSTIGSGATGRLLTYEEANALGSSYTDMIFSQLYFLATTPPEVGPDDRYVLTVKGYHNFITGAVYYDRYYNGVRPVITAPKSIVK